MSIDEIRKIHYTEKGREEGLEEAIKLLILKQYKKGLSIEYIADINDLDIEYVRSIIDKELV